ncbi:hypothetical protein Y032_0041g457 [Ancylostoma ceylanicum]|uniref:Uncharacterized protein n=1 Tax=Ancylostoma ceylanicum TaxID=53326 RepID=A0A016UHI0_9BILA|nr:hypothetical protein Y032_0041g457 [Ancylostoma ceylanicum]
MLRPKSINIGTDDVSDDDAGCNYLQYSSSLIKMLRRTQLTLTLCITDEPLDQNEHDYSLEELYRLLDVVQTELDSMRSNPEVGLRGHYIERLTRLEEKMQNFHECISQKLSAEKVEMPGGSGDNEVGDAIANVLAPYRDEPGTSGLRRFSREYARTETSTSRKNSRASI